MPRRPRIPRRRPRPTARSRQEQTFALGERSAADLVAPAALVETRAELAVDGAVSRVLALTD